MRKSLSLKELLARPAPTRTGARAPSAADADLALHATGPLPEPVSVAQVLSTHGLGLRKAHATLNRLAEGDTVVVRMPVAGLADLRREFAALNVAVVPRQVPDEVDVRAVRDRFGLTQREFAARFGLDLDAVQNWEQGRARPDRNARILLRVIATAPDAVERALSGLPIPIAPVR
jgi:DNA-binding transcriptional regulator YiaG